MKKLFAISLVLIFTGCAHDNYSVIQDSSGSKEKMSSDLRSCKHDALQAYYASQPPMTGGQVLGLVAGGVIGGAIGGAAFGATTSSQDSGTMKKEELNPYVEKCMLEKGYSGTSN